VRGRPGGVLGSLLVCLEDLNVYGHLEKYECRADACPDPWLSLFTFLFDAHWGGTCKEGELFTESEGGQ
jgi:hypothetical protein